MFFCLFFMPNLVNIAIHWLNVDNLISVDNLILSCLLKLWGGERRRQRRRLMCLFRKYLHTATTCYCCLLELMPSAINPFSKSNISHSLGIHFSSNPNIHKSSCGLCFWASDLLIDRFYKNLSIKGSEAQK